MAQGWPESDLDGGFQLVLRASADPASDPANKRALEEGVRILFHFEPACRCQTGPV